MCAAVRKRNKDDDREYGKVYREINRDREAARRKAWREANPNYHKDHYKKNKEKILSANKEWLDSHPGFLKKYREENPDKIRILKRAHKHRRRARIKEVGGEFTEDEINMQRRMQRGTCVYCPARLSDGYHIDHKTPIARGGRNDWANIHLTCAPCNLRKNAKTHEEFIMILENERLLECAQ